MKQANDFGEQLDIEKKGQSNQLVTLVQQTIAGLTGLAASEKKDLILTVGRLVQSAVSANLLNSLTEEWNIYREKGKIKEDYVATDQFRSCFQEILKALDEGVVDEERFNLMKKVLLAAGKEEFFSRNDPLPYQYMKLAKSLSSGEIIVLLSTYKFLQNKKDLLDSEKRWSAGNWLGEIADISGLKYPQMVEMHEKNLIENGLITPRMHSDGSGISVGKHFRLTDLGLAFCEYVESIEDDPNH